MEKTFEKIISGPTPGESLTKEPGAAKYEKPPQYAEVDDAIASVVNNLTKPKNYAAFLDALDEGMPIEALVAPTVFGGFSEGKWTVDVALLMTPILTDLFTVLAHTEGKDDTKIAMDRGTDEPAPMEEEMPMEEEVASMVQPMEVPNV